MYITCEIGRGLYFFLSFNALKPEAMGQYPKSLSNLKIKTIKGYALSPQAGEMRKFQLQPTCSLIHIKKNG